MTYRQRFSFLIVLDSVIVLTAIFFSRFLLSASFNVFTTPVVVSSLILLLSHHCYSLRYKLYKKAWEYASIGELITIMKAVSFSILTAGVAQQMWLEDIHFRLLTVTWMLHVMLIGGSRFYRRVFGDAQAPKAPMMPNKKRTLVIGAGSAGTMVARQLINNNESELLPVAFIDDNVKKHKLDILGIPVVGGVSQIERIAAELFIDNIVIAIPSLRRKEIYTIYQECAKTKAKTQIIPMLEDLAMGRISVNQFQDVRVEDLLGREPVELDMGSITDYLTDRTVLVTGAGGSIGSEICRQISRFNPRQLILLGHGENSIYAIELDLLKQFRHASIEFITEIADIQDAAKMISVMHKYRPDVVYHAAAHKHVPLMERNPEEALKNNIQGTLNVGRAASISGVQTFVMISTDKAVNPTSVMGATKRLAEMMIQHLDEGSATKFVAVRFGNVLGSRGSVIPLFKQQIEAGGPVTVTHPDMIRYFMTIPEASKLVIQAGAFAQGGEIFVLDMGEPMKIVDLARNLIRLSGNSVEEIGIDFTGIRPGEKLFEELLKDDEAHEMQVHPKIYVGKKMAVPANDILDLVQHYELYDKAELRQKLLELANDRVMEARVALSV
ncbi:polysaccharide biosynthesis protein EpsC [Paenibacillus swuensis]|uniref:Polysaccharide biosynthesis protein EpsC n=1 Tax=Paenibacillus swuensis TaxID=1178515 RepID=A0A172TP93_9BACL|nr:nucleoside-diphosphate sugar epimerase/dehydratase [Paenibacillus swuensis]ANE48796.1 polysaccharide biosynthesis protein EpsC [Paenibacillus swuensis]